MSAPRRASVVTLAALCAVALLAFVLLWWAVRDAPKLQPQRGTKDEAAAEEEHGAAPPLETPLATRVDPGGEAATSAATSDPTAAITPERQPSEFDPLQRVQLRGQLVDEHDRTVDVARLRAAAAGEVPRIWLTKSGQRLDEFNCIADGVLLGDVILPVRERAGLAAELSLGGRRFATGVSPDFTQPFTLRVDFSALALESSAATIVVRPNPQAVDGAEKFVVLRDGATRRAATIDDAGRARFETLTAATWRGVTAIDGMTPVEFTLELGERDDRELLVELSPGFRIAGVAAWDGLEAPLPRANVIATRVATGDAALQGAAAQLGGDGSFELGPLPAGEWRLQLVRVEKVSDVLHESVVTLGGREVERLDLRIAPRRPPTRFVRLLLEWPRDQPREDEGFARVRRVMIATFLGQDGVVVGRGLVVDPRLPRMSMLALPEGATVLELAWRDLANSLLLDSGVAVTRVPLPRVVQEGKSQDLKVDLAAAPRD